MSGERAIDIRRETDGELQWETVVFETVEKVQVVSGSDGEQLTLTLIGVKNGAPNRVVSGIYDIAERHELLVDGDVPRNDEGDAIPMKQYSERHTTT